MDCGTVCTKEFKDKQEYNKVLIKEEYVREHETEETEMKPEENATYILPVIKQENVYGECSIKEECISNTSIDDNEDNCEVDPNLKLEYQVSGNKVDCKSEPSLCDSQEFEMKFEEGPTQVLLEKENTKQRVHVCETCNKSFSRSTRLREHQLTHTGARPYECDQCKASFTHISNLNRHRKIHSGERPHVCYVCKKSFVRPSHLKGHEQSHTGDRPHECIVCKKTFFFRHDLKRHHRTHTGERPHVCSVCNKGYSRIFDLRQHLSKHQ